MRTGNPGSQSFWKFTQRLKYTGNMCDFHPLVTESPKILSASVWASLLDYNFLSYILSSKHKMHQTFLKFGGFVRQREVFVQTVLRVHLYEIKRRITAVNETE